MTALQDTKTKECHPSVGAGLQAPRHRNSGAPRIQAGPRGFAVVVILLVPLAGCISSESPDIARVEATVVAEQGRYVLVADSTGRRYIPNRIPFSYREPGLKVYITGRAGPVVDRDGRQAVLLELTSLSERIDE